MLVEIEKEVILWAGVRGSEELVGLHRTPRVGSVDR